jgi:protein TonB
VSTTTRAPLDELGGLRAGGRSGRLAWALALSALLHLAVLEHLSIHPLAGGTAQPILQVDLMPQEAAEGPAINKPAPAQPRGAASPHARAKRPGQAARTSMAPVPVAVFPSPRKRPRKPAAGASAGPLAVDNSADPTRSAQEKAGRGAAASSSLAPDRGLVAAYRPEPVYPRLARRRGQQGEVILEVRVGSDGRPWNIQVKRSSGWSSLDHAAAQAVQHWRFVPARRGGRPVTGTADIPIRFRLQDG